MRQCVDWQTGPSGKRRCAKYADDTADVLLAKTDDASERTGYFDIQEVESALMGLTDVFDARNIVPALVGSTATFGTTLALRYFSGNPTVTKYAPLIGAAGGLLLSVPMYWWGPDGSRSMAQSAAFSLMVGGGLFAYEWASGKYLGAGANGGTGLLAASRRMGEAVASGSGARVMPTAAVAPQLRPAIDTAAFGARPSY